VDRTDPGQVRGQEKRVVALRVWQVGAEGKTLDWVSIEPRQEG